jgi:cytochrome c553
MDIWPNLAGQKPGYLVKQMKAFRDGGRKDPMMSPMAAALTDDDIDNLAAYFSGL